MRNDRAASRRRTTTLSASVSQTAGPESRAHSLACPDAIVVQHLLVVMNPPRKTNLTRGGGVISRHELQEIIRHELGSAAEAVADELIGSGMLTAAGVGKNPRQVFNTVPVSRVIDRLEESNQVIVRPIIDRLRLKLPLQDQSEATSATSAPAAAASAAAAAAADDEDYIYTTAAVEDDREDIGNNDAAASALVPHSAACAAADTEQSASTASSTDTCNVPIVRASSGSSFGKKRKRNNVHLVPVTHQHDVEVWKVLNALPPEEREKQRKYLSLSREVKSLQSHNQPGLHGVGVDQETDITLRIGRPLTTRSACDTVAKRTWDEERHNPDHHDASSAILFTKKPYEFPRQFISDVDEMKKEFIDFSNQRPRNRGLVRGLQQVKQGYFKGHIPNDVASRTGLLPGNLQVKTNADQKGIIFYNTVAGQCVTHWDRDTSLLILLAGKKTVMIAPPGPTVCKAASTESNSSIYDDIDPFVKGKEGHWSWKCVDMKPNDALLIPERFLHAIQSEEDTVAISLQVQTYKEPKCYQDRAKELEDEAKQLEEALRLSREEADKRKSD